MNDTQLGDWMRSLPRANASPRFTSEVMRKARGAAEPRRPFVWRMAAAFTMVACLGIVVQVAVMEQAQRRRYAVLRAEHEKLQADLQSVKKSAEDVEPVVVLENDSGTRVIVSLDRDRDSAIQPAALRTYD
jgi:Tfp pilus assembly protein PilN